MIHLRPFKGYRPPQEIVTEVVSLPFDQYSKEETLRIAKTNPKSFINIIKPELAEGKRTLPYDKNAQGKSREKFKAFVQQGYLIQDSKPCFYIYKIVKPDFVHKGVIAAIASEEYHHGKIRRHEQTLTKKEEKLKEYLKVVGINAEPVMFTYPYRGEIDEMVDRLSNREPEMHFPIGEDKHLLWVINQEHEVNEIKKKFETLDAVYIADGHHRTASSVLLSYELALNNPNHPATAFMGIFFPNHNLRLYEFNRLLKDLNAHTPEKILSELKKDFDVTLIPKDHIKPEKMHEFGLYLDGKCYRLRLKTNAGHQVLDADLLNEKILSPIFHVHDPRHDERIGYISGVKGYQAAIDLVDNGDYALAFLLYPVSFEQFFAFSDQGKIMPPKTTWFEPKLLNGLIIYDLEVDNL